MSDIRETELAWDMRASAASRRKVLMVVGMHRSGTSATAGVLSLLGGALPAELISAVPGVNDVGFFEPSRIVTIHDELLALAGSSWHDISPLREDWFRSPMARGFVHRLTVAFQEDYGEAPLAILKDPRLCRLLPLWREVLKSLDAEPLFVIPFRHPAEVAASLARRDGFSSYKSQLLWLQHLLLAEHATRGDIRAFVSYEELLTDPSGTLARLAIDLGVSWPTSFSKAGSTIKEFLTRRHQHNRVFSREGLQVENLSPLTNQAYALLEGLGDLPAHSAEAAFDRLRETYLIADRLHGSLVHSLEDALAGLQRELELQRGTSGTEMAHLAGRIESLLRELADRDLRMAGLSAEAALRQEQLATIASQLQQSQVRLGEEIAGREEALARSLSFEALLREVNRAHEVVIAARDADLKAREQAIRERDERIELMRIEVERLRNRLEGMEAQWRESSSAVEQIRASTSWRLTEPLRKIKTRISPLVRNRSQEK